MSRADTKYPGFKGGRLQWHPENMVTLGSPIGKGKVHYVDGDISTGGSGTFWDDAFKTVGAAITAASAFDVIYVSPKEITDFTGDPTSYEENLVIPAGKNHLSIIGVSRGRTQGGLPQFKDGATSTDPILKIRSNGVLIQSIGFNGAGNTGGGILLDDDYSTKSAFATTIDSCHFKNLHGPDVDDAKEGGAIMWGTEGNAWQCSITNNQFYKNVADITVLGTTNTRPQDVLIQGNVFSGDGVSTDCNIYGGGSGFGYVTIDSNVFGALPSLGSDVNRYIWLTGTLLGMVSNNVFGAITAEAETDVTFGATGSAALIPTTVFMANNWGENGPTAAAADGAAGEVFRTA